MAPIGDFIGNYTIRHVSTQNPDPLLQVNGKFCIGTNEYGDTEPSLAGGGFIVVGFSILGSSGDVVFSTQDEQGTPLQLALVESNLRWAGFYQGRPLRIYISEYKITSPGGIVTRGIYATNVYGDPEQVGIWGADDSSG